MKDFFGNFTGVFKGSYSPFSLFHRVAEVQVRLSALFTSFNARRMTCSKFCSFENPTDLNNLASGQCQRWHL